MILEQMKEKIFLILICNIKNNLSKIDRVKFIYRYYIGR